MELVKKLINKLQEDNSPSTQLFYIIIGPVAYALYVYAIYYQKYEHIPLINTTIGNLLALLAFYYYIKSAKTDPGTITLANHLHHHSKYRAYIDQCIFIENNKCQTCGFVK